MNLDPDELSNIFKSKKTNRKVKRYRKMKTNPKNIISQNTNTFRNTLDDVDSKEGKFE